MNLAKRLYQEYDQKIEALNVWLSDIEHQHGLEPAFLALYQQQVFSGVCESTLPERYALDDFFAIVRLARGGRDKGWGMSVPPAGFASVNDGCFLCLTNIAWKSRATQVGMKIRIGGRNYVALIQPFAIEQQHLTIVRAEHVPHAPMTSTENYRWVLGDLVELAGRLPNGISFVNGAQAGASLRLHHHIQSFLRPFFQFRYPLEKAADAALDKRRNSESSAVTTAVLSTDSYPLSTLVAEGPAALVTEQLLAWADAWCIHSRTTECCGNWLAVADPSRSGFVRAYFVLRSPFLQRAPGFAGAIASVETLGQLVVTTEEGRARLDRGELSGNVVAAMLRAVDPPGAKRFLETALADHAIESAVAANAPCVVAPTTEPPALVAVIAIGGEGTRAGHGPKCMQLVYDKPVAYYLISQALLAGARHLVIVTSPEVRPLLQRRLGAGESLGVHVDYVTVQDPRGPGDLFRRTAIRKLVANKRVLMVLDGILIGRAWRSALKMLGATEQGCALLARWVEDPSPFGYIHLDDRQNVVGLSEKRRDIAVQRNVLHPVVTHMSVFDATVCAKARRLTPASSGEYQLPDLQATYARNGECQAVFVHDGVWLDAGTPANLLRLSATVEMLQDQGQPIGSPHWTALQEKLITEEQFLAYLETQPAKCPYKHLLERALASQRRAFSEAHSA